MSPFAPKPLLGTALLLATAFLAGCSSRPLGEGANRINLGTANEFALPVRSVVDRRFQTVVRQQFDFSCGSAALATLLRFHYGDPQSEQSVFVEMFRVGDQTQIRRLGFSLLDMKTYLASRGLVANGYRVALDEIARVGIPGIALINFNGYRHFVVVKGFSRDQVLLGDPSLGLRRESRSVFARQWNGIFFVISERSDFARRRFNHPIDLALAPGMPFDRAAAPVDLSSLALTRPLPGDF